MSTEFLLAKAAEKDRRILELEMRLHEVVQREQSLLKQLDTLYNEKNREREDKQILQCRVESLEAELSEYTDGSGLKYVTQDEATAISSPYEVEASATDRLSTGVLADEEPRNNYKHSNQWPRRLSVDDEEEMNIWVSPKKRSNWISTCDND